MTTIAHLPDQIRSYGPVKEAAIAQYEIELAALLDASSAGAPIAEAA